MTTRLALVLFAAMLAAVLLDRVAGTGLALAAARHFVAVVEGLAVWR